MPAATSSTSLPVGTVLDGKFRVTREIGRGGMAAVFEAENIDIGKRVAVKLLAEELVTSRVVTERFLREARASAAVRSPHICDVYDVGTYEDRPFLVLELLEGESLYDRLARVRRLDPAVTLQIATQAAKGLTKAHEANIVHRDLKPENIFLTKNEEDQVVTKLLDFGLAKFYEPANETGDAVRLTKEGALFGTPAYMSPEQAKAQGEVDHRTDLWALACIVYECLTGRTVWNVDQGVAMILAQIAGAPIPRPSRVRSDLPKSFDDWFLKALDREPDRRFQSARELADALVVALSAPEGSIKSAPLSTEEEGREVDQLVSVDFASMDSQAVTAPPDSTADVQPVLPSSLPPAAKARGPGAAIAVLLFASALVLGGYVTWFYVLYPTGSSASRSMGDDSSGTLAIPTEPLETQPFALQLGAAQSKLARGEAEAALELFRRAFESSKHNAARSLLAHAEVSADNEDGACRVTGLGRPRPFDESNGPSSRPAVAYTRAGLVVAWAETDVQARKRQGHVTLLDASLRRVLSPVAVTPEAKMAQMPLLNEVKDKLLLTYWDSAGEQPGVYVRLLEPIGAIAGPPRLVSPSEEKQHHPGIVVAEDGSFWVLWTERTGPRVQDLMTRRFDSDLNPLGDAVRLTRYTHPKGKATMAYNADAAIAHGYLNVVYALERGLDHHVFFMRIRLDDRSLAQGGLQDVDDDGNPEEGETRDRFLGHPVELSPGPGKHNQPRIACVDEGCFATWDDEKAGAYVAFLSASGGELVWHREIGPAGYRPSIATRDGHTVVAWFEDSRLRLAGLSRIGLGKPTLLAKVSGYQPYPSIAPGSSPGQWYISWRDFEAARHEAFVLRAECQ